MKSLFVSVVGQDDNIGDSALRRGMITSVRDPRIQLHVFVGDNSDGYVENLGLQPADVIYRKRSEWLASMRVPRGRGATSFLANAGEIPRVRGPRHLGTEQLRALSRVKLRGGALLQTGVGVRHASDRQPLSRYSVLRVFDIVTWRDSASRAHGGVGVVAPDWGFATGGGIEAGTKARDQLAISLRGDFPFPEKSWFESVQRISDELQSKPVIIIQVRRDGDRGTEIARELKADVIPWNGDGHGDQEDVIRSVYRRSSAVISDRLHALVIGATEGAYPLGMPPQPSKKLGRTLAPARLGTFLDGPEDGRLMPLSAPELATRAAASVAACRAELDDLATRLVQTVVDR